MNATTVKRLNAINQEFYRTVADSFDETRGKPWPGWERLHPYLNKPLSVLDIGCGNGRFGLFLAERLGPDQITYHGIDSNPRLLEHASAALVSLDAHLALRDIVENPVSGGPYDLVVLFGLLHHIPGGEQRRTLIQQAAELVAPGGWLAFATWRFYEFERYRARIVPWPADLSVETHDYLLDWRRNVPANGQALRYCHYIDDAEHTDLIAASGLTEITTYRADGKTNSMNSYSLLRKETE